MGRNRKMGGELKADLAVHLADGKRRRGALDHAELAADGLADCAGGDTNGDRIEKVPAAALAGLLFLDLGRFVAEDGTAWLARPVNLVAVLVEDHGGAA